jgi:hypothetical protein
MNEKVHGIDLKIWCMFSYLLYLVFLYDVPNFY